MHICLVFFSLFALFLFVVLVNFCLKQFLNSFRKRRDVAIDECRPQILYKIIDAFDSSTSHLIVVVFAHDGEQTRHNHSPEMFLQRLRVPDYAGESFLDGRNRAVVSGLDETDGEIGVAVANLNANILIKMLVMFLEQSVCFLKVGSELERTRLSEFSQRVNGSCLLILLCHFLG